MCDTHSFTTTEIKNYPTLPSVYYKEDLGKLGLTTLICKHSV